MNHSFDELNERCYNAAADRWNRFPFPEHLCKWVETHLGGSKVLEIGPGNGLLAEWLETRGCRVECVEPSEEMARRCRARGLKVFQSTLQNYTPQETFDAVFAICSLVHIPKSETAAQINKIASCLRDGGTFFLGLIEGCGEGVEEAETGFPRFFSNYQKEEILPLLDKEFDLLEFAKGATPRTKRTYLLFALKRCCV